MKERIIGSLIFFVGIILLALSQPDITGNVIANESETLGSVFGLIFILVGIFLMLNLGLEKEVTKEESSSKPLSKSQKKVLRIMQQQISSNAIGKYSDLDQLARKAGYVVHPGGTHPGVYGPKGNKVLSHSGQPVTIPTHKNNEKKGTYQGILKDIVSDMQERYHLSA